MAELKDEDIASFRNFVRMDPQMFQELSARLGPRIEGTDTWMRKALTPELKLAITLRHLTTGDSYRSLMYGFRVAHNTVSLIACQVCRAISAEYAQEVISTPTTPEEWLQIADQFGANYTYTWCWSSSQLPCYELAQETELVQHPLVTVRHKICSGT